jgi:hypothetical protein
LRSLDARVTSFLPWLQGLLVCLTRVIIFDQLGWLVYQVLLVFDQASLMIQHSST